MRERQQNPRRKAEAENRLGGAAFQRERRRAISRVGRCAARAGQDEGGIGQAGTQRDDDAVEQRRQSDGDRQQERRRLVEVDFRQARS